MTKEAKPWRNTPVTVGLLGAVAAAVATIAYVAWSAPEEVAKKCNGIVGTRLKGHEVKDVDMAHPSLPKRYVTREELAGKVSTLQLQVGAVETQQRAILRELRQLNNRRHRRRRDP